METKNKITTFNDHLDREYGKIGEPARDKYEQEFEAFKLGVMLQEMRKSQKMTQEQL